MIRGAKIYCGHVHHERLRPKQHSLRYSVFSMLINVDDLEDVSRRSWLFGYNRWAPFSIYDKDFGRRDGAPIAGYAREMLAEAGIAAETLSISLLAYPRVMGYAFNPLSVYYCAGEDNDLCAMIYEVTNTFGERQCYVVRAGALQNGVYSHRCAKQMYVSPFAPLKGQYGFRITSPSETLLVGVNFRDEDGPLIKTFFRASAKPFHDSVLLKLGFSYPLMTLKVIIGIHIEAFQLWLKRIPLTKRPATPPFAVSSSSADQH